jgi:hypothetical protein
MSALATKIASSVTRNLISACTAALFGDRAGNGPDLMDFLNQWMQITAARCASVTVAGYFLIFSSASQIGGRRENRVLVRERIV